MVVDFFKNLLSFSKEKEIETEKGRVFTREELKTLTFDRVLLKQLKMEFFYDSRGNQDSFVRYDKDTHRFSSHLPYVFAVSHEIASRIELAADGALFVSHAPRYREPRTGRLHVLQDLECFAQHLTDADNAITSIIALGNNYYEKRMIDKGYFRGIITPRFSFNVLSCDRDQMKDVTVRALRVKDKETGSERRLTHYHYGNWPDMSVPEHPETASQLALASLASPGNTHIHCLAGAGRSGVMGLLIHCARQLTTDTSINVSAALRHCRTYRFDFLQTPEQYVFLFKALQTLLKTRDASTGPT